MRTFVFCLVFVTGCFHTRFGTMNDTPIHRDRQWFAVNGLIELSAAPSATECSNGISYASSKLGLKDLLITMGIGLVGGLVASAAVCDGDSAAAEHAACVGGGVPLASFLLESRTLEYQCK